ncbi:hypothetical protein PHYSODRAFT_490354 [Phytophthora sojae]|uniref:Elicitin n=1 Tax=Phytophthora sojae (strain P6497) TaxID=1094619 RepID=G4Z7N7_PHYSP|nr:hypothetical protein PHYSODRAFT_490354 [Phytophthora sojae]EGZ21076.1 hypothetical protein PHYSODRAFT_490354 [Phytophthora sojae]|eukprot:XP_009523793.1 hypothetical protein PHYSODRAFT_490354 [Phytophthora sojae]
MKTASTSSCLSLCGTTSSATTSSSSSSDACSSTQQTLLTLDSFQGCIDASGYSLLYSTSLPTDAEYVKMSGPSDCQSIIEPDVQHRHDDGEGDRQPLHVQRLVLVDLGVHVVHSAWRLG